MNYQLAKELLGVLELGAEVDRVKPSVVTAAADRAVLKAKLEAVTAPDLVAALRAAPEDNVAAAKIEALECLRERRPAPKWPILALLLTGIAAFGYWGLMNLSTTIPPSSATEVAPNQASSEVVTPPAELVARLKELEDRNTLLDETLRKALRAANGKLNSTSDEKLNEVVKILRSAGF